MTTALLSTAYLAPTAYYRVLHRYNKVSIEQHCNYVKQTYRNRCVIATTNGLLPLSIPIEKPETIKAQTKDIRIATHGNWQHLHWNAIVSAYNSSPFFEYYEDDFRPFYEKQYSFLFDFNEAQRTLICKLLDITPNIDYSEEYLPEQEGDFRESIHPKKALPSTLSEVNDRVYYQVFQQKFGFQPNLSIIDLLFNMGPESVLFL